jgi:hypothetical protein
MQGFVRRVLGKSDDRTGCERERWRELVQDRVQLWTLVLVLLTVLFLVPQDLLLNKKYIRESGLEEGMWLDLPEDRV